LVLTVLEAPCDTLPSLGFSHLAVHHYSIKALLIRIITLIVVPEKPMSEYTTTINNVANTRPPIDRTRVHSNVSIDAAQC